eukprot:scaffold298_cov247-Pinguiococcus_pyrenoidosus.AAC.30
MPAPSLPKRWPAELGWCQVSPAAPGSPWRSAFSVCENLTKPARRAFDDSHIPSRDGDACPARRPRRRECQRPGRSPRIRQSSLDTLDAAPESCGSSLRGRHRPAFGGDAAPARKLSDPHGYGLPRLVRDADAPHRHPLCACDR